MEIIFLAIIILFLAVIAPSLRAQKKNSPDKTGEVGEQRVARALGENIPNEKYIINGLIIAHNGKTSQIDHVVINRCGIFVIETKNYSGWIYGGEKQNQWTQVLAHGREKHKFYNPISQNNTHICRLKAVLGNLAKGDCFVSIIVFPRAEIKTESIFNVGDIKNLKRMLDAPRQSIFSVSEINAIYHILLAENKLPEEHVARMEKINQNIANNICPRCGMSLVLRKGKHGSFYGCEGYPYCKFTKQI